MSFFSRLFKSDPVDTLKKAFHQKQYAEVLSRAQAFDLDELEESLRQEVETMMATAGDALAGINFEEGEAFLRAGDRERAADHFVLASAQVKSELLREKIQEGLKSTRIETSSATLSAPGLSSSCVGSCCPPATSGGAPDDSELPPEEEFELILAGYPMEWAEKYIDMVPPFFDGFLHSHRGDSDKALTLFQQVAVDSRTAIFFFERGSTYGRLGETEKALADLRRCLELEPQSLMALETLIHLEKSANQVDQAERRLQGLLKNGFDLAFCHGHLALIHAAKQSLDRALEHGVEAVRAGSKEPEVIFLTASLLESRDRLEEAEILLGKLQGGGCGGVNIPLAEFWLRHGKNSDKALESFKKASAHEPQNLKWAFRMAEAYLAKGWKREGEAILNKLLQSGDLDSQLVEKGRLYLSRGEQNSEK
ncbi:tetratricopeptide repeat protein [Desulfuromonas sp. AOP6]|uniref:tetratricopeptide repeat protein n=1 Tax=Desulfuromonas sp. AOP6 TaxID=1566351 RepID=UPI0012839B47|nr:tetratricopeptide repeat protein [Desulfuromonas sp. AOP6]BCA79772.1 hypothetical protein AOP6_1559 [Desulfuromonas sp. AOP6]